MFYRNGQALGSINYAKLAGLKAERPKPRKQTPKPVEPEPVPESVVEPEAEQPGKAEPPKEYASKHEWVDWAVAHGENRDQAEEFTKAELIELYGGDS